MDQAGIFMTDQYLSNKILGQNIETEGGIKFLIKMQDIRKIYTILLETNNKRNGPSSRFNWWYLWWFFNQSFKKQKIERGTLKNDIGALIFSSNQAKEKFLIDDIIDFDLLIKNNKRKKFKDYKVINIKNNENIMSSYFINLFNLTIFIFVKNLIQL